MKKEKAKPSYEALYLGENLKNGYGDISHQFRTSRGEIVHFKQIRGLVFGDVVFVDKDCLAVRPKTIESKLSPTEKERLEYGAMKEIVKHERLRRRKAIEMKKPHKDIVRAVALLRPFARGMDRLMLKRFAEYLETQLSRKTKK